MDRQEFVDKARVIVEALGSKQFSSMKGLVYQDDIIVIRTHYNGLDLEVERKAQPNGPEHLRVSNPTTMVSRGEIIRHHGEHAYLVDHLNALYEKC